MIDALFNQPNLLAAKRLLDVSSLRHEAIAANLANLETPNYKRVDVSPDFERQLRSAVNSRDAHDLRTLQPQLAIDTSAVASRTDGNTVDLESELLALNRNGVEHAVETQLITGALLKLRTAITGHGA
jgi:flagellar basal-body rod protein FlgB